MIALNTLGTICFFSFILILHFKIIYLVEVTGDLYEH